jgi:hypothetical protein
VNNCSSSTLTALPYNKNTCHPEQFSGSTVFQFNFIIIRKREQHQNRRDIFHSSWQYLSVADPSGFHYNDILEFPSPGTTHRADAGCQGWRTGLLIVYMGKRYITDKVSESVSD